MVREELGEDAIIVATREEKGGKGVRLTAAVEPGFHVDSEERRPPTFEVGQTVVPSDDANTRDDWLQYDDEDEESAVTEEITDAMLRHGVSEDVMDQIISCSTVIGFEQPSVALVAALEHLFHFEPIPTKPLSKALMLVGPPGAGKTIAAAKLAARGAMNDMKIGVITADTIRAGGAEQLGAFTKLLDINLQKVKTAEQLREKVNEMLKTCDQVIIDTPGSNPFDRNDIKKAAQMIGSAPVTPVLVLPAGIDANECSDIARAFASIGAQSILGTRIDMARRLGGLLCAAHHGGLSFCNISNTPRVADGFDDLSPQSLCGLLMPGAKVKTSVTSTRSSSPSSRAAPPSPAQKQSSTSTKKIKQ